MFKQALYIKKFIENGDDEIYLRPEHYRLSIHPENIILDEVDKGIMDFFSTKGIGKAAKAYYS